MNCGDCGTKLIVISSNHGVVAYCPKCVPDVEKAFTNNRGRISMTTISTGEIPYLPTYLPILYYTTILYYTKENFF